MKTGQSICWGDMRTHEFNKCDLLSRSLNIRQDKANDSVQKYLISSV